LTCICKAFVGSTAIYAQLYLCFSTSSVSVCSRLRGVLSSRRNCSFAL